MATTGLKNLYYAILQSDTATASTYATPVKLGEAVSVDVNPSTDKAMLYGDDMPVAAAVSVTEITVTIETTDITLEQEAALLGHEFKEGTLIARTTDAAPYVALMYEKEEHTGKIRCGKLLKGKFNLTQETANTKGESVDFQVPSLEGSFVARLSDGAWKKVKEFDAGTSTAEWYTSVD